MPSLKKPRALRPGDRVAIAAPAGPVEPEQVERGEALVRSMGFEPVHRSDLTARRGYLAGSDERRADELRQWLRDPTVAAILCARGGYGCTRVLSRLDPKEVRERRKALVGYSDVTSLLLWQRRLAGLIGIHGPMLEGGRVRAGDDHERLARALMGAGRPPPLVGRSLRGGWREGRLTGGSLSLVVATLGTPYEVDTRDAILMIEEVNEAPYRIDRMLEQLRAAGKLAPIAGVGVGQLVGCDPAAGDGPDALSTIVEALEPLEVPIVVGLPFGHGDRNQPWPHGGRAAIDGDRGEVELLEHAVARR